MNLNKTPVTPAIRALRANKIAYSEHVFEYQEHGGAQQGARELAVDPHALVKTLILEDAAGSPLIVLMHGDCEVSLKNLARTLNVKSVKLCDPKIANRYSGYQVGGTSPFGTRRAMPVYLESSVLKLPVIYINGGKRGFLLGMDPQDLVRLLKPTLVNVSI